MSAAKKKSTTLKFTEHNEGTVYTINNVKGRPKTLDALPPAIYRVKYQPGFFSPPVLVLTKDELINERYLDLGGPAAKVLDITRSFFDGKHVEKLKARGFLNKLAMLLHGLPGTGKSLVSNEVARMAIEKGAIVLRPAAGDMDSEGIANLVQAVKDIRQATPDQLFVFQFDDCEAIFSDEAQLINLLDGEGQQEGILWLFTTNYGHRMPERVMSRTRRIQFQFPFGPPSTPMRRKYLELQGIVGADLEKYVKATKGLTIDQIAGLITSTLLFDQPADEVLEETRIRYQVRNQQLDFTEYTEAFYGEKRDFKASMSTKEGYITDPISGRQVLHADVQASLDKARSGRAMTNADMMNFVMSMLGKVDNGGPNMNKLMMRG